MAKVIALLSIVGLCVLVFARCGPVQPRVKVEPVCFDRPDEIVRGTGEAKGYWVLADRRTFAALAFTQDRKGRLLIK